jgi:hypothetical protein
MINLRVMFADDKPKLAHALDQVLARITQR